MSDFDEQIARVLAKLTRAREADRDLGVFGATSHRYKVGKPASEAHVREFEQRYGLSLPPCYRAFVTRVGNGGASEVSSAAGPYCGIYPLGESIDELVESPELFLRESPSVSPETTEEEWARLRTRIDDKNLSEHEFDVLVGKLYAGLMPIGSQGCTFLHALTLTGPHRGRVVYCTLENTKPWFVHETNFLDWYERWLDEVIRGDLLRRPSWFATTLGGTDLELAARFRRSEDVDSKLACLAGLLTKANISPSVVELVESQCQQDEVELRKSAVQLLTKIDYQRALPHLKTLYKIAPLPVFQFLFWYAKEREEEWKEEICEQLATPAIPLETFRFVTYVAERSSASLPQLLAPYLEHSDEGYRRQAEYAIGKWKENAPARPWFRRWW